MKFVASKSFEKRYKKLALKNPELKYSVDKTLLQMEKDIFHNSLQTHKLTGKLSNLWAVSCGYDCRIIFELRKSKNNEENIILLIDFGTHNEIY